MSDRMAGLRVGTLRSVPISGGLILQAHQGALALALLAPAYAQAAPLQYLSGAGDKATVINAQTFPGVLFAWRSFTTSPALRCFWRR